MRVKNEADWQRFLADVAADADPRAVLLRDFTVAWAEAAEMAMKVGINIDLPMQLLRNTLHSTELAVGGRATIGMIGSSLVLLCVHWAAGGNLYEDMTCLEQRLVEDTTVIKLEQLARAAETANG